MNRPERCDINDVNAIIDGKPLASITIRNLDEPLKGKLRVQAAKHGRSMEEEARCILRAALAGQISARENIFDAIRARVEPLGGVDLEFPTREPMREPPRFGG